MAVAQKQDIFKRLMWFSYDDAPLAWVPISVDRVKEIIELNKKGESPALVDESAELVAVEAPAYGNVVGQDSLTRFDNKGGGNRRKKKRNKPFNRNDRRPKA